MKIAGVEIIPLTFEWRRVIEESFGTVGKREFDVVVKIVTDEGVSGLGEAMTLGPFYSGESQGTVAAIIAEEFTPRILLGEDPFNVDKIHFLMDRFCSGHSIAKTAVDEALYDIMGKALGVPLYRLLGGKYADRIPLRWAIGIGKPEEMAEETRLGWKAGYKAVKTKGGLSPRDDVESIKAIRKAVGDEMQITVDINQSYDVKTAIRVIRAMEEYGVQLIEQPVHRKDLRGMAMVRRAVTTPIGACESALTLHELMDVIHTEAADFLNFKVSRSGGFYVGKQMVHAAEAAGICVVGSTQLGMGIELAANAHFAASTMRMGQPPYCYNGYGSGILKLFNAVDSKGITKDIVTGAPVIENGYLSVPERPGLGVELNEENVNFYLTKGKSRLRVGEVS